MLNNKLVLNASTKFEEAIQLLDKNGNGVLPVINKSNVFIGLITDGDIRKAILNKHLDLEHIINKHPYKYSVNSTDSERLQFLKSIKRRHLPLVDNEGCYAGLFVMDEVAFNHKPNTVVIMAGGLGTRLGELTKETPKPMLHVGKKPILESIIDGFIDHGFHKFLLSVNYKSEKIVDHFGDGKKWGVEIEYLHEGKRLGTAGGLSLIEAALEAPFLVTNGDVITTLNYEDLLLNHTEEKAVATMCVREYEYTIPYGVVDVIDNQIKGLKEKPTYQFQVNAGVYVLDPAVLSLIPKDTYFDMPSLFEKVIDDGKKTLAYKVKDYWIDVGHADEFQKANEDLNGF